MSVHLPNYFLADLPPEAELSAAMVTEACQTLRRNAERYLAHRSTLSLVEILSEIANHWLKPDYPFRKLALEQGPAQTGFASATLSSGLDAFFNQLTHDRLQGLLTQELAHRQRLDGFVAAEPEQQTGRRAMALGPKLLVHVTAGNLPNPALMSIVLGLLVRSAQFVKCASGSALLPRLLAHSLYEVEPKLGACLEIAEWRRGRPDLEKALYAEADCVTATGDDETIATIRGQVPSRVRFVAYGHRVSFGYVTRDVLTALLARQVASKAAEDVAAWNQLGCLSPHLFYVEQGGNVSPDDFAALLAAELARGEAAQPRGPLPTESAAAIASRRLFYEVRAAASPETRLWQSEGSTSWTVVYEADPAFQASCLNRFVYVKPVDNLEQALHAAEAVREKISTVALAASDSRAEELAGVLARWGATRICPIGRMQTPSLLWRHDGRPSLGDLVTWVDWEQE